MISPPNPAQAERLAGAMPARFVGFADSAVMVDMESGDMSNSPILCQFGEIADIAA